SGTGLITGERLSAALDARLKGVSIEGLAKPYVAVATEIGTGNEVWLSRGRLVDAMRASYALPGVFRPVRINGRWLFDGALVNPVPVSVGGALGARYVIAVNVNWDCCSHGTVVAHFEGGREPLAAEDVGQRQDAEGGGLIARNGRAMKRMLKRQLSARSDGGPGI